MNILIVTGEKSAENYSSLLVDSLLSIDNTLNFYSVCSNILDKKTIKIADYREISIIGIKEAVGVINKAFKLLKIIKKAILENNINVVVLMDFPEFNMRIAKFTSRLGIKTIYYISPQVWAWREYRIKALFKYSNLVIPILPFEKTFFNIKGINKNKVSYCGHPIIDLLHDKLIQKENTRERIILIMPGSRKSEIEHNYKVMFEAAKTLREQLREFQFVWVLPDHIEKEFANTLLEGFEFLTVEHDPYNLMKKAYLGILKSGTTTLEAAMLGLPMVVVYRISKTSYSLGKLLIKGVKHISLPNLIAGEEIVKEFVGSNISSESIVKECLKICNDPNVYKTIEKKLKGISCVLGEYPVTQKIAQTIYFAI